MKTLSDFKKRLTVGTKLEAIHHFNFEGRMPDGTPIYGDKNLGTREVSIVQSNSFALKTTRTTGEIVDSWCQYPKAKQVMFKDSDTITILEEQRDGKIVPVLTYKFV